MSTIPINKKVTIQTSIQKSEKTSDDLGNLHVDNGQENGERKIGIGTLYLEFRHFQGLN